MNWQFIKRSLILSFQRDKGVCFVELVLSNLKAAFLLHLVHRYSTGFSIPKVVKY